MQTVSWESLMSVLVSICVCIFVVVIYKNEFLGYHFKDHWHCWSYLAFCVATFKLCFVCFDSSSVDFGWGLTCRLLWQQVHKLRLTRRVSEQVELGVWNGSSPTILIGLLNVVCKVGWCREGLVFPVMREAVLRHWGWNIMATILQPTFSNAFYWVKMIQFRFKFHWNLFPWVQSIISQHWLG